MPVLLYGTAGPKLSAIIIFLLLPVISIIFSMTASINKG